MPSDRELVNFGEDHELNTVLSKLKKRQTEKNRELLREIGADVKKKLDKRTLTHPELYSAANERLGSFE